VISMYAVGECVCNDGKTKILMLESKIGKCKGCDEEKIVFRGIDYKKTKRFCVWFCKKCRKDMYKNFKTFKTKKEAEGYIFVESL